MALIPLPSAGGPILESWGDAVAAQLNAQIPILLPADVATNNASFIDLGGSCAVVAGSVYTGLLIIRWSPTATSMGAGIGFSHPGGTMQAYMEHMNGAAGGTVGSQERVTAVDTGGPSSTDNTNARISKVFLYYACTVSGTLMMRGCRKGTSGAPGITYTKGSGGILTVQT